MQGEITRIDVLKKSYSSSDSFKRVYFKLKDKDGDKFAKTDIVPTFRNYKNWQSFLKVGIIIGGLKLRSKGKVVTVDADCKPYLIKDIPKIEKPPIQNTLM